MTGHYEFRRVDCGWCWDQNRATRRHCPECGGNGYIVKTVLVEDVTVGDVIPEVVHVGD